MKGKKVTSLKQLCDLALDRKSVVCESYCFRAHTPAAFMQNLQGAVINRLIQRGMYVYKKPLTRKK